MVATTMTGHASVSYWILMVLFAAQAVAVCFTHCLTARLALGDTLFLVVALFPKGVARQPNGSGVLRTAAIIAFEALMFANLTHAAQMLIQRHDQGLHLQGVAVGLTLADIIIKLWLLCRRAMPDIHIGIMAHLVLHFSSTCATLIVASIDYLCHEQVALWADPSLTLITAAALAMVAFPAFMRSIPPLFGDIPTNFKVDQFQADISAKFPSASCEHLHVYQRWPSDSFDAFLTIAYRCSTDTPDWQHEAQRNIVTIQKEIRSVLTKAGAIRVTVQPQILPESGAVSLRRCVDEQCIPKMCC